MKGLYTLKLCLTVFIFVNCNSLEFVSCQNETLNENIVATFYKYYYTIVKLSNNFHQFPMRDDFRKTIPSPATQTLVFHKRLLKLLELYGVSKDCREDILQVNIGLENGNEWARRMVDSTGKPGARLVDLRYNFLGAFDECDNVRVKVTQTNGSADQTGDYDIKGTYFTTYIKLSMDLVPESSVYFTFKKFPRFIRIDSCLPHTCSGNDVNLVVQAVAGQVEKRTSPVLSATFSQKYIELTTAGYVIIGLLCFLAVLLVTGTTYDILVLKLKLIYQNPSKSIIPLRYMKASNKDQEDHEGTYNMGTKQSVKEIELYTSEGQTEADTNDIMKFENVAIAVHTGKLHEFFMSFSVIQHSKDLFEVKESRSRIGAVEGIRVLTMGWIILSHTLLYAFASPGTMDIWYRDHDGDWSIFGLLVLQLVESFFTISGFLVTYISLNRMESLGNARKFPWLKYYIFRFWRISPTFYLVFFVFWKVFPSLASGPIWLNPDKPFSSLKGCDERWWTTLLYIDNLSSLWGLNTSQCSGHFWYLAADTQFYVLSPLLLIPFFYFPKVATGIATILGVASAVVIGALSLVHKFLPSLSTGFVREGGNNIFLAINQYLPIGHLASWMIGMILGYILWRYRNKIRISKLTNIIGWSLALSSLLLVVYLPAQSGTLGSREGNPDPGVISALYYGLSKTLWSGAVAWIIFACAIGHGGFINSFLSWKPFVILGRLTFCTYLVHVMVILFCHNTRKIVYNTSNVNLAFDGVAAMVISYAIGFVVSVCFERPMFALKNIFVKNERH